MNQTFLYLVQRLNQMQEDLDAETAKLNLLLIEQKQLDKLQAEKEKQEFKELQKCIIELAAFAIKAKRHEEQNMTVEKLKNELSILEAKKKELIDHEDDYLNDNNIVQVERCQFESFFKDPNDFPYLKSLKKIEDEKIFKVPFDIKYPEIHDENAVVESIPKLQNQSSKRARRSKQALTSTYIKPVLISSPKKVIKQQSVDTSKSNTLIITKKSTSKDLTRISPILNVLNSPNNVKAAPKKQEVLTDKIPVNKSRVCSVNDASQDLNNLSSIDDALQQVEPVQTLPQKTSKPIIYSSTPKRPKIIDDSKNAKIVRISVDSPVTAKVRNLSPSNKANIVSVEILPHPTVETKLSPQSNIALRSSNRRLLSQEIVTQTEAIKKSFQTEQTLLVNNDNKKKTDEIKVIVETPKEMIWKSPPQKTLNDGKALSISDCCSETSDNEHIFNDDFDICSVKSGNGSELNFLSPNSNRSFNMDTVENDNAEVNTKDAFDFGSFPESEECAGGSLF